MDKTALPRGTYAPPLWEYPVMGNIWQDQSCRRTDSEVQRDGRILDLIDDARREDKLPYEDVAIPLNELPEPEQDNGGTTESVKEQEMKWTGTSLVAQWLRIRLPMQGTRVQSLVWEDPTCHVQTKPVHHDY